MAHCLQHRLDEFVHVYNGSNPNPISMMVDKRRNCSVAETE